MANFYHRYIPKAAAVLHPLHVTLKNRPTPDALFPLTSDASDRAVGAVLEQFVKGSRQPLAFFRNQLRPFERKHSTFDRELLGLYFAVRHFKFMLEGRFFITYTDHKPLVGAMSKVL